MSGNATNVMSHARQAQSAWASLTPRERSRKLRTLRHVLALHLDEFLQVISEEVGKPSMDVLTGDMLVTLEQMLFYERQAAKILRPKKRGKPWFVYSGTHFEESLEPHGVVLIFAPWNYPLQLSVVPMVTALFAGNAVLLKCSERTPRTATLINSVCKEAGLPQGLVTVSWDMPDDAESLLDASPNLIFFTGSSRNGRIVAEKAGTRMIPAVMELGGKDSALVFASCNLERTVKGLVYGCFSNAGQVCVGTKRIYVERSIYDKFLQEFLECIAQLRIGVSIESDLGPILFQDVKQRLQKQVEDAIARGARAHTELRWGPEMTKPIVLTDVPSDASLLAEESFGPVVCVASFQRETEAVRMSNSVDFAMSASVWTGDASQGRRISLQLQCGTCAVNDVIRNIGNPQAAFGGNGSSGYGRYHGEEGLRTFSRVRTVMTAHRLHDTEVHWFPFCSRTFQRLRGLIALRHGRESFGKRLRAFLTSSILLFSVFCGIVSAQAEQRRSLHFGVTLPPRACQQISYLFSAHQKDFRISKLML